MSIPNNSEKAPEANNKKNDVDLLWLSQKDFINSNLTKDINYFNIEESDFSRKVFNKYLSYLNLKDNYKKLWLEISWYNDTQKDIIWEQLKKEILKILLPRKNNLKNLEKKFNIDYSLNSSKFKEILSSKWNWTISDLLKNSKSRDEFLLDNNIFNNREDLELSKNKDFENKILKSLNISKSKLKELPKETLNKLFNVLILWESLNIEELNNLFLLLSDKSKISFVKYFFDSFSLEDINNLWLDNKIKRDIENKIKSEFKSNYSFLSNDEINEIYDNIDKSEVFIDSKYLDNKSLLSLIWNEKNMKDLLYKYNNNLTLNDDLDGDSIYSKLTSKWENNNINDSFIDYIKSSSNISFDIKNTISKLKDWNYIKINDWNKEWVYRIKKVDNWNIKNLKDIVLEELTTYWWVKKDWKWIEKKYSYDSFYDLLKIVSIPENKNYNLDIISKEDFKKQSIPEIVEDNEINNIIDLKNKLDLIDPEGKDIEFNSNIMTFTLNEKDKDFVFLIDKIDEVNQSLIIDEWNWKKEVSFLELIDVFRNSNWKLRRTKKINTFTDSINELTKSWLNSFDWLIFNKKNELLPESEKDNKDYKWTKYLTWPDWVAIYIDTIEDGKVKYYFWEFKKWNKEDKKKWKKAKKNEFKWEYFSTNFSQFVSDIKKYKVEYNNEEWNNLEEKEFENIKEKSSFFMRYMSWLSLMEIYEWLKFFPESIKKKLERWNRLKSLKMAKAIAWKIAGKDSDFYLTMKSQAAEEEKKLREEKMNELWSLWSKDMLKQIEDILLNKDSDPADLTAAMFKVVAKYGTLYPKSLNKYQWSLIWYKKIWWTKEFELEHRKWLVEAISPSWKPNPVSFTEERLVESFLAKQEKDWKVWPRTDKEFWNNLSAGIKEEMEDWAMKSWNQATTQWRIDYFLWELWNLTFANAIWSLPKIFAKNDSSLDMNAWPFALVMSWYWKDIDQSLLNELMNLSFTTPYTTLYFAKWETEIKQYQNFIRKVIEKKYSNNTSMLNSFDWMLKITNPKERIKAISNFWSTYWNLLVDIITLKDPYIVANQDVDEFKWYYETLKAVQSDDEFMPNDDEIKIWAFDRTPTSMTGWLVWKITSDTVGWFWWKVSKKIYKMYLKSITDLKDNSDLSIEQKKELFKKQFSVFEHRIREVVWRFKEWDWLKSLPIMEKIFENNLSLCSGNCEWSWYDAFLDKSFENFMNWGYNNVLNTESDTKLDIDDILEKWEAVNNPDYNSNNTKQSA